MDNKSHKIVGIFTTLQDTHAARNFLIERGIAPAHINLITPDDTMIDKKIEPDGDGVAKEVVKDAIIGGAIGGGIGAAGAVAIAATSITLFVASPLIAPLALIGWGAMVGAVAGGGKGAGMREDRFADMIKGVTNVSKFVLIVHTTSDIEFKLAHDTLAELTQENSAVKSV